MGSNNNTLINESFSGNWQTGQVVAVLWGWGFLRDSNSDCSFQWLSSVAGFHSYYGYQAFHFQGYHRSGRRGWEQAR